ncbi:hypothetical protein JKP88DRAFT_181158 [Tribonema minus]|uniref:Cysteine dioxygenase n=1 Tax=Tribonema minus TaxID=303371 RepID=A0A836CGD4_9STRA|nr:hypothetical protein JKP88DRAFT_181158 [Tribonema minus]
MLLLQPVRSFFGKSSSAARAIFSRSNTSCVLRGRHLGRDSGEAVLQRIYDSLNTDRSGDDLIEQVTAILNTATLRDVGLQEGDLAGDRIWKGRQQSLYIPIAHTSKFDIAVFIIKKGNSLPLHDHPDMTVLSKLLHGKLRLKSFDWIEDSRQSKGSATTVHAATCINDREVTAPADAWRLGPHNGNLHDLEATETSAVLDILLPPYGNGRRCSYYKMAQDPVAGNRGNASLVLLKQVPEPRGLPEFYPYTGPSITTGGSRSPKRFWQ